MYSLLEIDKRKLLKKYETIMRLKYFVECIIKLRLIKTLISKCYEFLNCKMK